MQPETRPGAENVWMLFPIGMIGLAGIIFSSVVGDNPSQRFYMNCLLWFVVVVSIALGALFLVGLEHLVSARWSIPLRRVAERVASLLWVALPLAGVGLAGLHEIYPWASPAGAQHPWVQSKAGWLNAPFFAGRTLGCLVLWLLFYQYFSKGSLRQDDGQAPAFSRRAKKIAALFMVVFAVTVSLTAFDWLMSLELQWFSTIIGVYFFSGCVVAGLAAVTLATLYLMDYGRLRGVKPDHLYNLGALLFGFNAFWAYIAFSQFMLIWYANLPEEVTFFTHRWEDGWAFFTVLLPLVHFAVPFFALLSREAKCSARRLRWVAIWILGCHVLDMYWLIFPAVGRGLVLGWQEFACAIFFVAGALLWLAGAQTVGADMAHGDPNFREGVEFKLI